MTDMHPVACAITFATIAYLMNDVEPDDPLSFGDWVVFLMMTASFIGVFVS